MQISPGSRRMIVGSVYLGLLIAVPLFALWMLGMRTLVHRQGVPAHSERTNECSLKPFSFLTSYRQYLPAVAKGMKQLTQSRKSREGRWQGSVSADAALDSALNGWQRDDYFSIGQRF